MDPVSATIEVAGVAAGAVETVGAVAKTAETVGEVAQVVGEAAKVTEIIPNPVAAANVLELATNATGSEDILAGRDAIESLTRLPDNLGLPEKTPVVQTTDKVVDFTPEQEATADTRTKSDLERWDQEHPQPDPKSNPEEYKKWCEDRWEAEIDYIASAKTNISMKEWDKQNPEPDKAKNPDKHKEWLDKRAEQENVFKEKHSKEAKNLKAAEKAAVLAEIRRLRELYSVRADIVEAIKALRRKEIQTDEEKITLGKLQDRKLSIDSEIRYIEADLKLKQSLSPPVIALMIATALISMQIYKVGQQEGVL